MNRRGFFKVLAVGALSVFLPKRLLLLEGESLKDVWVSCNGEWPALRVWQPMKTNRNKELMTQGKMPRDWAVVDYDYCRRRLKAGQKYNPYAGEWETVPKNWMLRHNPHDGTWRYHDPRARG